jgi:putative ABC transport system permease protein
MTTVPGHRLIAAIALLVPEHHRDEWKGEWLGELAAQRNDRGWLSALALRLRCLGAISDAFWFRRRYREPLMLSHNLRFAMRLMHRRPGFSTVVILTLALGIGGTTAIYSVVNAVLLRQLPYPEPDRLVMLHGEPTDGDVSKVNEWSSYPDFVDLKRSSHSFESFGAYRTPTATLTVDGTEPGFVLVGQASQDIFRALMIEPALGRSFRQEEETPGAESVSLLSDQLWRRRFGADPKILGKTIHLDGTATTVVGVFPAGFRLAGADLWTPLVPGANDQHRGAHTLRIIARLKPGIEQGTAEREVKQISTNLEQLYPENNAKRSARLELLLQATVGQSRDFLLALMGGVGLVLLIVCCNVANLFLVRAAGRGREIAVRTAVGAGRGRIFNQFLAESLVLTVLGAIAGLPLAWWGLKALIAGAPQGLPRVDEIGIDPAALAFMLIVAIAAGVVFGTVPSLYSLRHPPGHGIRERGLGPSQGRFSRAFVVSQLALAAVLVIGASLLAKSLWRLNQVDLRFNPDRLLVAWVQLPSSRYETPAKVLAFHTEIKSRLEASPGIESVSRAFEHPLSEGWTSSYVIEGEPPIPEGEEPESRIRPVAPGYFKNVGLALTRGRDISTGATLGTPGEVVVNEAFVDKHFAGQNPLGRRVHRDPWWPGQPTSWEIVGVAANERFRGLQLEADPATYFPHAQFPMNDMYLVIRTRNDPAGFDQLIRQTIWNIDRDLAIDEILSMDQLLGSLTAIPRFNAQLIGLFAAVALLLAAIGIYGVLAHMVTQRTPEIGIRLALGAEQGTVLRMVVGQGLKLSLMGAALGLLLAIIATRILATQLYRVPVRDPVVFASVAAALVLIAILAAYLPGRRASRVDPIVALRND